MLRNIGRRIVVQLANGTTVEGWYYGQIPQGLLISEDLSGERIRLVSQPWKSQSFPEGPLAKFAEPDLAEEEHAIDRLSDKLTSRLKRALRRLDYRPLQRFADRASQIRAQIYHAQHNVSRLIDLPEDSQSELAAFTASRLDEVIELHSEVFAELEESGVAEIVAESSEEISFIPIRYTLPAIDGMDGYDPWTGIEIDSTHQGLLWSAREHRQQLDAAREVKQQVIIRAIMRRPDATEGPESDEPKRPRGTVLRYFGASLQILMGTGLATGNVGLALTAGLTSTIATIGAALVPTYVGVGTSICVGMVQVSDGLGKIGVIQKDIG